MRKATEEEQKEQFDQELNFESYASVLDEMNREARENMDIANLRFDEEALERDLELLKNLSDADQKRKDSLYSRRAVRQSVRRRGGLRQESPFFDDD